MFVVPSQILELQSDIGETTIDDGFNYIIHFSFCVIEGGNNVRVCSVERLGNGLKIRFRNKSGVNAKLQIYKILNPHILEKNYNCCQEPIFIGNTLEGQKVEPNTSKSLTVNGSTVAYSSGIYNYAYRVTSGSEQIYVVSEEIYKENKVSLTFFNAGNTDSYIDVSTIEENKEVSFSHFPPPHQGISLLEGNTITVDFSENDLVKEAIIERVNPYGKIISYTFKVEENNDIYVCGQFYDESGNLHIKFSNESGDKTNFKVQGWETIPYR